MSSAKEAPSDNLLNNVEHFDGDDVVALKLAEQVKKKGYIGDTPPSRVFAEMERMKVLHLNKIREYTGDVGDPLRNYKVAAKAGGMEPWRYAMTRVFEKAERMKSILKLPEQEMLDALVKELPDTALMDLITIVLIKEHRKDGA